MSKNWQNFLIFVAIYAVIFFLLVFFKIMAPIYVIVTTIFSAGVITGLFLWQGEFTEVLTGTQKFVVHGGRYVKTLFGDSPAFFAWAFFGKHFVGFKFQNYKIHKFQIDTTDEGETGKGGDFWVIQQDQREVDFLKNKISRVFALRNREIQGGQKIGVMATLVYDTTENGHTFVFDYGASFKASNGSFEGAANTEIATIQSYQEAQNAGGGLLQDLLDDDVLLDDLFDYGFDLEDITVKDLERDESLEEAANKVEEQRLKNEVITSEANAKAGAITIIGNAEAGVVKSKALAKYEAKILGYKSVPGVTFTNEQIYELLLKTAIADAITETELTTLVYGSNTGTNLNIT